MIVTRRRRKKFPYRRVIVPIVVIALVVFAFSWPPVRNAVSSGPMGPAWRAGSSAFDTVAAPFHFSAQNQIITERNRQIATLQSQVTAAQNAAQGKDKQIASLQQQVDQLESQAASARSAGPKTAAPRPAAESAAFGAANPALAQTDTEAGGDLSTGATPDARRTAQYWGSMDPENAAKIVQRLPPSYVARIFALMQPDGVGAILDALPPTYAAKLTQEHPELQR